MEKERIVWLDQAKALGIFLVVAGHAIERFDLSAKDFWGVLHYFIYCFHMPYFFVLSGISYGVSRNRKTFKARDKLKYIFLHCFDFFWALVLFNILTDLPVLILHPESIINQGLTGIAIKWLNHFWYIAVLSLIYVIVPWIKRVDLPLIAVLLCAAWLCGIVHMGIAKFFLYLVCFLFGAYLSDKDTNRYGKKCGLTFLIGSMIWFLITNGATLMDVYSKTILGLTGSVFLIDALRIEQNRTEQNRGLIAHLVISAGRNTLIIYLTHYWIICWEGWGEFSPSAGLLLIMLWMVILTAVFIFLFNRYPIIRRVLLRPSTFLTQGKA